MAIAYAVVIFMGIALLVVGGVYWAGRDRFNADPILIASCVASGVFLLASSLVPSL